MIYDPIEIRLVTEGSIDQTVMFRLITEAGAVPVDPRRYRKSEMKKRIQAFNKSATTTPYIVLVDLDHDNSCAPELCRDWIPNMSEQMCFRVAIREIESWLLADREHIARFFGVKISDIPEDTDSIDYPKEFLINLARHSTDKKIIEALVPRPGSGRVEGPAYIAYLTEFVTNKTRGWRPSVAGTNSDSLFRCIKAISKIVE